MSIPKEADAGPPVTEIWSTHVLDTPRQAERVIRGLSWGPWQGQPEAIRLDNGPFPAERFMAWINRTYRTKVLKASAFESLEQVREITAEWLQSYNEERPPDALAGLPLATYRANLKAGSSPLQVSP